MTEPRTMHPGSVACDVCVAELPEQYAAFPTVCPHRTSEVSEPVLRGAELVWISVPRKDIDRHKVNQWTALIPYTGCGRSTRTGELRPAHDPWIVANTTPCPRCWPDRGDA